MAAPIFTQTQSNFYARPPQPVVTPRITGAEPLINVDGSPVLTPSNNIPPTPGSPNLSNSYVYNSQLYDANGNRVNVYSSPTPPTNLPGAVNTSFTPAINVPGVSKPIGDTSTTLNYSIPSAAVNTPYASADQNQIGLNRLSNNGLTPGAQTNTVTQYTNTTQNFTLNTSDDKRVYVTDPSGKIVNGGGILGPLKGNKGVLFPYTPTIQFGHSAHYDSEALVHTNYEMPVYRNSSVDTINITAKFTANTADEAAYVQAVLHFFRSATKMFYGADSIAGTPPPVLRLDGYGQTLLPHLPVVCIKMDYTLPEDVDYISTNLSQGGPGGGSGSQDTMIPTNLQLSLGFKLVYSRNRLATQFGLEKFASGALLSGLSGKGTGGVGGFI
jgi:hypothetical protein